MTESLSGGATATLDTPAAAAAALATRMATSWFEIVGHTATTATKYWSDAFARGATPADVLDDAGAWLRTVTGRREPTWSLPNTVIASLADHAPARLLAARRVRGRADADPAAAGRAPLLHRRLQRAAEPGRRRARPPAATGCS